MSFIIEQKIKGHIYLYEVESYWDSEKKQPRQRRKYLGRKKDDFKSSIVNTLADISVKIFGDVFLLQAIISRLGLDKILEKIFPGYYKEIIALAFYEISQSQPSYLFPYWLDEHKMDDVRKLDSTSISGIHQEIGHAKDKMLEFEYQWVEKMQPIESIYYDITSFSSYATNNDFIEWGYNRDGEKLPQINLGAVCCSKTALPLIYRLFGGSIVDVTTLKNTVTYLKSFGVKDFMCIMDRGFYSKENLLELNKTENNIRFIQPIPFTTKKVKDLVTNNKRALGLSYNAFSYNQEVLYYVKDKFVLDEHNQFEAHIFYNEKSMVDQKQVMMQKIIAYHDKLNKKHFENRKQFIQYRDTELPASFRDYFRWDNMGKSVERNNKAIETALTRLGTFIIATNQDGLTKEQILSAYRKRDAVEKIFDMAKNELDGDRLRVHSNTATEGSLFIKFIALILYCEITKTLKANDLFKKFTVKEMFAELRKIKMTSLKDDQSVVSELSKRHKQIFDAFNLDYKLT